MTLFEKAMDAPDARPPVSTSPLSAEGDTLAGRVTGVGEELGKFGPVKLLTLQPWEMNGKDQDGEYVLKLTHAGRVRVAGDAEKGDVVALKYLGRVAGDGPHLYEGKTVAPRASDIPASDEPAAESPSDDDIPF